MCGSFKSFYVTVSMLFLKFMSTGMGNSLPFFVTGRSMLLFSCLDIQCLQMLHFLTRF